MKKKLALIVISLDECFSQTGFSGGGHKVTKKLIQGLVESGLYYIDVFCKKSAVEKIDGVKSITVLNKKTFVKDLKAKISGEDYDYVLSSDILLPFANNLIHSNSSRYKSKNGKSKFMQSVLKFYNFKKIKAQENSLPKDRAIFTVSENLKNDYVQNYSLDEKNVFVAYPAVDEPVEFNFVKREAFVIGGMAGGGLNKGGYLLLLALSLLPKKTRIKARIIFPKIHKSSFFKAAVKLLGLSNMVEILPKQKNMDEFYKTIDCYVLPSLNEAFGLVVTEAALNYKPSIVSSTAGVSELVKDGQNGFVFDRQSKPLKGLVKKLAEVSDIYFNNEAKFVEISKNAHEISTRLDWKRFTDTLINNMIGEK